MTTTLGGHLDFHFTSGGGFNAGDYTYQSPTNVNSNQIETFHYVITDGDGDHAAADLAITVQNVNHAPFAEDDAVITNISGSGAAIAIPDAALLLNDTDSDGQTLTISSSGFPNGTSGSAAQAGITTTFTDDNLDGGSFSYTAQDGGSPNLTDTASVTVNRSQSGESQLEAPTRTNAS